VIVGAGLLVFFVLLVTDILGLTHVFPFVTRRHSRLPRPAAAQAVALGGTLAEVLKIIV
jgi:hypothetical protein